MSLMWESKSFSLNEEEEFALFGVVSIGRGLDESFVFFGSSTGFGIGMSSYLNSSSLKVDAYPLWSDF